MTPQETDIRNDHPAEQSSTPALLPAKGPNGNPAPAGDQTDRTNVPLFAQNDTADFRSRWDKIQTGFVDEPRDAVQRADELVASAIKRLAEVFANERQKLDSEWDRTDNVSTEDLRLALRKYRSFFDRLLSV